MNIKPLSNRVLIELRNEEEEKTTKSGIVLPDSMEKKEQSRGTVVAVGPGKMQKDGNRIPVSVKVGEQVIFSKPWGDDKKFEENDKTFFLVDEDEILAVVE